MLALLFGQLAEVVALKASQRGENIFHNSSVAQPQKLSGTAFLGPGHMFTLKQVTEIKGDKICSLPRSRLYAQFLILIL